jgi:dATP pyrophosphohydrolase
MNDPVSAAHDDNSYRTEPAGGPRIRSDVIDVYVFQRAAKPPRPVVGASAVSSSWGGTTPDTGADLSHRVYFLQLQRTRDPLGGTWQPIMGHCEKGETAVQCALREMAEEVGLSRGDSALRGVWALEQVHPFFIAELDAIVMSPRFAVEVAGGGAGWTPRLNDEHAAYRWVHARDAMRASGSGGEGAFMWPGQRAAAREIVESLLVEGSVCEERLRVK